MATAADGGGTGPRESGEGVAAAEEEGGGGGLVMREVGGGGGGAVAGIAEVCIVTVGGSINDHSDTTKSEG